jgi:hypothetical protein
VAAAEKVHQAATGDGVGHHGGGALDVFRLRGPDGIEDGGDSFSILDEAHMFSMKNEELRMKNNSGANRVRFHSSF